MLMRLTDMDPARKRKLKYLVILILVLLYGGLRVYRINTRAVHFLTKTEEHLNHQSHAAIGDQRGGHEQGSISPEVRDKLLRLPTPVINELFRRPSDSHR